MPLVGHNETAGRAERNARWAWADSGYMEPSAILCPRTCLYTMEYGDTQSPLWTLVGVLVSCAMISKYLESDKPRRLLLSLTAIDKSNEVISRVSSKTHLDSTKPFVPQLNHS